jgi:hypothetical protein
LVLYAEQLHDCSLEILKICHFLSFCSPSVKQEFLPLMPWSGSLAMHNITIQEITSMITDRNLR